MSRRPHCASIVPLLVVLSVAHAASAAAQTSPTPSGSVTAEASTSTYLEASRSIEASDRNATPYGVVSIHVESGEYTVSTPYGRVAPLRSEWLAVDAQRGRVTVQREGDAGHGLRLDLASGDSLRTSTEPSAGRRGAGIGALLVAVSTMVAATAGLHPLLSCDGSGGCVRPTALVASGLVAMGLELVAGILWLTQPDAAFVEVRRGARTRRYQPHARGFSVPPALFMSLAGSIGLGVLPYIVAQEPTLRVDSPWDALAPGMVAMVAAPFLATMGGELGGGRGQLWAAFFGSLLGWAGMGVAHIVASATSSSGSGLAGMIFGTALSSIGSTIGYAVSDSVDLGATEDEGDAPRLSPTIHVGPSGGDIGIGGGF